MTYRGRERGNMSFPNLIINRSAEDVQRAVYLGSLSWDNMTPEERTEYLTPLKGAYNAEDLNRVTEAMEYLVEELAGYGYRVPYVQLKCILERLQATQYIIFWANVMILQTGRQMSLFIIIRRSIKQGANHGSSLLRKMQWNTPISFATHPPLMRLRIWTRRISTISVRGCSS